MPVCNYSAFHFPQIYESEDISFLHKTYDDPFDNDALFSISYAKLKLKILPFSLQALTHVVFHITL